MSRQTIIVLFCAACEPMFDDAPYLIDETRVLAVVAEPAESLPGESVHYRALVATPNGTDEQPGLTWSFCEEPKPITEDSLVGAGCLSEMPDGAGATFTGVTPHDTCSLFGPDPPPGELRPRDPDITGGYYQPLLVRRAGPDAIAALRITCNLARAPVALSREYRERYRANQNPTIGPLSFGTGDPNYLPPNARIELSLALDAEAREHYVRLDPASKTIVEETETLTVSWFITHGALETRRTTTGENILATPAEPGPLDVWVVARDSRGGAAFQSARAIVVGNNGR